MKQLTKNETRKFLKDIFKRDQEIYIILENIQYARNVASIFRTAETAGVKRIYLTGISHKPPFGKELRQASKGKEDQVEWIADKTSGEVIQTLKALGFMIIATSLTNKAIEVQDLKKSISNQKKICLIFGSEVFGVNKNTLEKCDLSVFIPSYSRGGTLNVSTEAGIVLWSM